MPKVTFKEARAVGEQFLQFLQDSGNQNESNKHALKALYNQEFRNRDNIKRPNFSSVLYVLVMSNRAIICKDYVRFVQVKKKVKLIDQYWKPKNDAGAGDHPTQDKSTFSNPLPLGSRVKARSEFVSSKNGVKIISEYDKPNGRIRFNISPKQSLLIKIEVKNCGTNEVMLERYILNKRCKFTFVVPELPSPVKLLPGSVHSVLITCQVPDNGFFHVTMRFDFTSEQTGEFIIGRFVDAVASTKLEKQLGPSEPYQPYQVKLHKPQLITIEDGFPPDNTLGFELEQKPLGHYKYPKDLKDLIPCLNKDYAPNDGTGDKIDQLQSSLKATLEFDNYSEKFCLLLHLEEIQMEVDIHRYDMKKASMFIDKHNKKLLVLKAPGVAENRPSVLKGDHLFVSSVEGHTKYPVTLYKGYVHAVELAEIKLGFSEKLRDQFIDNMKFDVTFSFSRLPLRIQHRAAILAQERKLSHLLFPFFSHEKLLLSPSEKLRLYDSSLEKNEEQKRAVYQVVSGISRPAPYLIFGPPGTGKTVTMVEAIKQVLHCIKGAHVLACAPSNSASDLLCQLLMKHLDNRSIYRMNASSRDYRTVPEEIKPVCNWDKAKNCPTFPSKAKLQNYQVIITTLLTAGRLVSADFPQGHFSHVFIDESGHAMEPESLIAVSGILAMMDPETNVSGGQLVLAGDPQQLGPILRSPLAVKHGLGLSLLERLMRYNPLYQKMNGKYDSRFVTMLLRNYRSHAAILEFPNLKFYDGALKECAEHLITHSYCNWEELVTKEFPIIFHGVCGEDQREGKSPSFFNTAEISVLIGYLKKLLENQGKGGQPKIAPKEIGIITPYRKQVEKIRQAINMELKSLMNIKDLKVGSVEEFQGQERRVVLISTVRSSSNYFGIDEEFNLGFLSNPKRLNVSITRAKALLIIVGNPVTLSKDPYWNEFLAHCREGYRGYQHSGVEDEILVSEFSSLNLDVQPVDNSQQESYLQQQVEPEWRYEH
ncbi:putative helicase MOV-10 isoform X1 [Python bivittatus]|uniref:RNA helicase n=1 Tax=Python bivittatus TaxID=176946 RepID=A0A9F5I9S1_PYTBI|nr:putative helicase MOV-10 isoform X1 [Python bivittatus]